MLPPARDDASYRIAVVCLGNICRSPMGEVVLQARLSEAGLGERVQISSFGTGGWHVGNPMDSRAAATLTAAGYDATRHRASQFTADLADEFDLVLAMDEDNLAELRHLGVPPDRLRLFRYDDPHGAGPVPDPYYNDRFDDVLAMVERSSAALTGSLVESLAGSEAQPGELR